MKLIKLNIAILLLLTVTSCVTTLPLNQQFYNSKKVGVIVQVDSIGMAKAGSQGLLDMAFTSGNRFMEPLQKIEPKLNMNEIIKSEISKMLNVKNKQFQFITEKVDYKTLIDFDKPNSDKKYCDKDFRNLKKTNEVEEILYVRIRYGILVSYYGVIETGKQGYVNIATEIIDLTDNSLLQKEILQSVAEIKGNWKKGEDFENLKKSIENARFNSINLLKTKF